MFFSDQISSRLLQEQPAQDGSDLGREGDAKLASNSPIRHSLSTTTCSSQQCSRHDLHRRRGRVRDLDMS